MNAPEFSRAQITHVAHVAHGTLLTAPFVLCLIPCALSSLAPNCLVRILRTLSILDTLICFAILRKKETRQGYNILRLLTHLVLFPAELL